MNSRETFLKGELENIYRQLDVAFDYAPYSQLESDKRFLKIFELLFEMNDKVDLLRQVVKGSYLILVKWKLNFSKRLKRK